MILILCAVDVSEAVIKWLSASWWMVGQGDRVKRWVSLQVNRVNSREGDGGGWRGRILEEAQNKWDSSVDDKGEEWMVNENEQLVV